jgi:hypothetical protein
LDITWLKDKSLADLDNLPDPDVWAEEIAENLESALGSLADATENVSLPFIERELNLDDFITFFIYNSHLVCEETNHCFPL